MTPDARWPRAALFDLDGTLIDSTPDIAVAVAELLATEGLPDPGEPAVRDMVGRGVRVLVGRAFALAGRPLDEEALSRMLTRMMEIYPRHLVGRTRLMPGTIECLDALRDAGAKLAVVTNKPEVFTDAILQHFGLATRFDLVLGDQPLATGQRLAPKPAPDMLLHVLRGLGTEPADAIMIGDSESDVKSAQAAGVFSVGVRGGYTTAPLEDFGPDLIIDTLAELPGALLNRSANTVR